MLVYPWSPGSKTSGRSCSRDARHSAWPLLALCLGWWRRRALDRCAQGSRSQGRGLRGGILRGVGATRVRGVACCGLLGFSRGYVHMLLRVLRVLELQL